MRIATWNVNSVTARLPRVLEWLAANKPDVVALQELKCTDAAFPMQPIQDLGYEVASHGTGRWNGVALLSRVGLVDITRGLVDQPQYEGADEPRAIGATCGGVRIWSVYVPNGREPGHDHYNYKLTWFAALQETIAKELAADPDRPLAVIGDYNVAPTDEDVWDITQSRSAHQGAFSWVSRSYAPLIKGLPVYLLGLPSGRFWSRLGYANRSRVRQRTIRLPRN